MRIIRPRLAGYLLALASAYSALTFATSLEDLQASGRLRIDSALTPAVNIVPGQRVRLTLEVATDTWFTGGTRITIPEVPGLVILQTDQFANNASETRHGQSWVVQRWTLDVFPQRAGDFTIGPVALHIQVNAGDKGSVRGELYSPAQNFNVAIPQSLVEAKHWVAAPEFRVSQSFDRALEGLAVGDAFEQEVQFEASDVLAMMLPSYDVPKQVGLAAYPAPPQLNNSSNRGQTLARRSVRISYVIEQPGQYLLPARDYYWWNTQSGQLTLLSLPATRIDVAGAASARQGSKIPFSLSLRQCLALAAGALLALAAVQLARHLLPRLPVTRWRARLSQRVQRLRKVFKPALAKQLNPGSSAGE